MHREVESSCLETHVTLRSIGPVETSLFEKDTRNMSPTMCPFVKGRTVVRVKWSVVGQRFRA